MIYRFTLVDEGQQLIADTVTFTVHVKRKLNYQSRVSTPSTFGAALRRLLATVHLFFFKASLYFI